MDRTEATLRKLFTALPAPGYDLGILSERGMYRLEAVSHARILRMLPYLKDRNANGADIYIRHKAHRRKCLHLSRRPHPGHTRPSRHRRLRPRRRDRDKLRQLPSMATARTVAFQGFRHPCREDACRAVRRRLQRHRLAQVRTSTRLHQPKATAPQRPGPLSFRTSRQSPRPALPRSKAVPLAA